jgi:hypothetical protein
MNNADTESQHKIFWKKFRIGSAFWILKKVEAAENNEPKLNDEE